MNYLNVVVDSECRKVSTSGMTLAQNSSDNIIYFSTPTRYSNVRAHFRFPNGIVSYILHMVFVGYDSDTQLYRYGLQIPYAVTNFTMPSATARLSVSFHGWKEDDFSKGGAAVCDTSIVVNRSSNTDVYDPSYNGTDIDNLWRYLGNISSEIDKGGSLPHVLSALPSNLSNYSDGTILCVQSDNELVFYRIKTAVAYKIGYGLTAIKTELDDHETRISQMDVYGDRISQCEADIASLKTRITTRKTLGLKMIGSAPLGTRLYDASGLPFAAGVNDGKAVSNGFDLMPIYAGMDKVRFPARDSAGNILYDANGVEIDNVFVFVPQFYKRHLDYVDGANDCSEFDITTSPAGGFSPAFVNIDGSIPNGKLIPAYNLNELGSGHTYTKDSNGNLTATSIVYLGCQKGMAPIVNYNMQSLGGRMSYIKLDTVEPHLLKTIPLTRLFSAEGYEDYNALAYLIAIEFGTIHVQSKVAGLANDGLVNLIGDQSAHNVTTATNKIALPTTNYIVTALSAGRRTLCFYTNEDTHHWVQRTVTNKTADMDLNGSAPGYTLIEFSGTALTFASGSQVSIGWGAPQGFSEDATMVAKVGSTISNADGLSHFSYRGIEDIWGNLSQALSDLAIANTYADGVAKQYPLFRHSGDSETTPAAWAQEDGTDITLSNATGYVKKMAFDSKGRFFPHETGASSDTYYSDYYWQAARTTAGTSDMEVLVGGLGNDYSADGLFYWDCHT